MTQQLLEVENLTVQFKQKQTALTVLSQIFLTIKPSETVCLVGESGSGKSVLAKSILRLIENENGQIVNGQVVFQNQQLSHVSRRTLNSIRGKRIAMIFQEPSAAFNPVYTIGEQLVETIRKHLKLSRKAAWERGVELLTKVGLSEPAIRMKQFPNELSGGMLQRAMIAMALSCNPELLIADEPTTALDVTIQSQVIELLKELQEEFQMALLLITHDLGVASRLADRVVVMYAGSIVEEASIDELFREPHHPYTRGLIQSIPKFNMNKDEELFSIEGSIPSLHDLPVGCKFHLRCPFATDQCRESQPPMIDREGHKSACWHTEKVVQEGWQVSQARPSKSNSSIQPTKALQPLYEVKHVTKKFKVKHTAKPLVALNDVSLSIYKGETFGLVGESGSGKSTLGKIIMMLEQPTNGEVLFDDVSLLSLTSKQLRQKRRDMQMVFQDPYGSMNPKWTIRDIIAEPLITHEQALTKTQIQQRVLELMELVGLKKEWIHRYPHEFSGGQRQRIGIARAIALNPTFILADEALSALDVSVQAQIIKLLQKLKRELDITLLFIGHDLGVVKLLSDRIGVMYLGELVEIAPSEQLFEQPLHPYSKALIDSAIILGQHEEAHRNVLQGEIPSPLNPPSGCHFRTRCPFATEQCASQKTMMKEVQPGRFVACHYA